MESATRPDLLVEKLGLLEGISHLALADQFWINLVNSITSSRKEEMWERMTGPGDVLRSNIENCVLGGDVSMLYDAIESKLQDFAPMPNGWKIFAHDPVETDQKPHVLLSNGSEAGRVHIDGAAPNGAVSIVVYFCDTEMTYVGPLVYPSVFDRLRNASDKKEYESQVKEIKTLLDTEELTSKEKKKSTPKVRAGTMLIISSSRMHSSVANKGEKCQLTGTDERIVFYCAACPEHVHKEWELDPQLTSEFPPGLAQTWTIKLGNSWRGTFQKCTVGHYDTYSLVPRKLWSSQFSGIQLRRKDDLEEIICKAISELRMPFMLVGKDEYEAGTAVHSTLLLGGTDPKRIWFVGEVKMSPMGLVQRQPTMMMNWLIKMGYTTKLSISENQAVAQRINTCPDDMVEVVLFTSVFDLRKESTYLDSSPQDGRQIQPANPLLPRLVPTGPWMTYLASWVENMSVSLPDSRLSYQSLRVPISAVVDHVMNTSQLTKSVLHEEGEAIELLGHVAQGSVRDKIFRVAVALYAGPGWRCTWNWQKWNVAGDGSCWVLAFLVAAGVILDHSWILVDGAGLTPTEPFEGLVQSANDVEIESEMRTHIYAWLEDGIEERYGMTTWPGYTDLKKGLLTSAEYATDCAGVRGCTGAGGYGGTPFWVCLAEHLQINIYIVTTGVLCYTQFEFRGGTVHESLADFDKNTVMVLPDAPFVILEHNNEAGLGGHFFAWKRSKGGSDNHARTLTNKLIDLLRLGSEQVHTST